MFPQFPNLVRVITHKSDHKGSLIEQFKKEDSPRIAITVDLLETGIDVPEVVGNCAERSNENTGLRAIASNFQRNFLEVKVRPLDAPGCRTE